MPKFDDYPAAGTLTGAEHVVLKQGGLTVVSSTGAIAALAGGGGGGSATEFASVSAAAAASLSVGQVFRIAGYYAAGDGGEGLYLVKSSIPSHANRFALAGGLWAECISEFFTPKQLGAKGDNATDDSTAVNNWINALVSTGKVGFVPRGQYRVPSWSRKALTAGILHIFGEGADESIFDGSALGVAAGFPTMFYLQAASFVWRDCGTKNIAMFDGAGPFTANIPLFIIDGWTWTHTTDGYNLYLNNPYGTGTGLSTFYIDKLQLTRIQGDGGICGINIYSAYRRALIDQVEIRNIVVPFTNTVGDPYYTKWYLTSDPTRMKQRGTAAGFVLGDDTTGSQGLELYCLIGDLVVDGVTDQRYVKNFDGSGQPIEDPTNTDGVRITASYVQWDTITVSNVSNHSKKDCTGTYLKATYFQGGSIRAIDAGHHEASVTFKGAAPTENNLAKGKAGQVNRIEVINTQGYVGRPGVYFRCTDIKVGDIYLEGVGGDVEDPYNPGQRINGASGCIRMSPDTASAYDMGTIHIGRAHLKNCVMGGTSTRSAVVLNAYKYIDIDSIECEGLSNAGLFSTQVSGNEQAMNVVALDSSIANKRVRIGRLSIRGCSKAGKVVTAMALVGQSACDKFILEGLEFDNTVDTALSTAGTAVGSMDWRNSDISAATGTKVSITGATFPTVARLSNIRGYLEGSLAYTPGTINSASQGSRQAVTVTGARVGDYCRAAFNLDTNGMQL
ncbi:MAG: hypothetical protein ACXWKX_02920, partial [Caulobacteraceae bacterium]